MNSSSPRHSEPAQGSPLEGGVVLFGCSRWSRYTSHLDHSRDILEILEGNLICFSGISAALNRQLPLSSIEISPGNSTLHIQTELIFIFGGTDVLEFLFYLYWKKCRWAEVLDQICSTSSCLKTLFCELLSLENISWWQILLSGSIGVFRISVPCLTEIIRPRASFWGLFEEKTRKQRIFRNLEHLEILEIWDYLSNRKSWTNKPGYVQICFLWAPTCSLTEP